MTPSPEAIALADKIIWVSQGHSKEIWGIEFLLNNIQSALSSYANAKLEEAARIADKHPFDENASPDCADAQGCIEVIAAEIRALKEETP